MLELLDPVLLARIQFAFTIAFHIIFPAFTIGLAAWLAVVEWRWLRTGNPVYQEVYRMWVKIFAVCFGMGVVSGVVMSYQFGTNWSVFSDKVANILGPLLGYEVLTAFFLEASFLGIMLFGWGRVSRRMHFTATCIVAVGTLISAFWILSANSWMQTPQGFTVGNDGLLYPTSWMEIIFNPSFPYRYFHMVTGAFLTTAFVVGGVGSYYLFRQKFVEHAKVMVGMAMLMAVFVAPAQIFIGDMHGLNTLEHQPAKIAAMEGLWDTEKGAGLRVFAVPNQAEQKNDYEIVIPKLTSMVLTHDWDGEVKGLKEWAPEDQPPVMMTFFAFRVMVGIGVAMAFTGVCAAILYLTGRLFTCRAFQLWCMLLTPSGFIAVISGWIVTEVGRQPYTAYGVIRTSESISPVIPEQIAITLLAFIIVYTLVFGAGSYYILKLIRKGVPIAGDKEEFYDHSTEAAVATHLPSRLTGGSDNA
ncbi:MAG: cytochrome ubiquinol oxidase subunit I [Legionellales bacterium]|nr:cytochrome ubiquinol oxidase subunit I [Legionellales bacterium]